MSLVRLLFLAVLLAVPVTTAPMAAAAPVVVAQEGPAVEVPPETAEEEAEPWTARYLVPTVLAMAGVAVVAVIVLYGVLVRGRYRVVR